LRVEGVRLKLDTTPEPTSAEPRREDP
jgi:hypothetical protein